MKFGSRTKPGVLYLAGQVRFLRFELNLGDFDLMLIKTREMVVFCLGRLRWNLLLSIQTDSTNAHNNPPNRKNNQK